MLADERHFTELIAEQGHECYPTDAPAYAKGKEAQVRHPSDTGDKRREGADDGDESGVNDGLAAVFFIELLRPGHIFPLEKAGIGTIEDSRTRAATQQVTGAVTNYSGGHQHQIHDYDVQIAGAGHDAHREQAGITREEATDEQSGFREDDGEQQRVAHPARHESRQELDEALGVCERSMNIEDVANPVVAGLTA